MRFVRGSRSVALRVSGADAAKLVSRRGHERGAPAARPVRGSLREDGAKGGGMLRRRLLRRDSGDVPSGKVSQAPTLHEHARALNEEIRRRERVVRIFPNEASAVRLIGGC